MGRFSWLFELPSKESIEAQRFTRLALLWLFAFVVVIRTLALMQFLLDLDYSEINSVKLTQFVFIQTTLICLLIYLMTLIWNRPHKMLLGTLLALCGYSLYHQADIVAFFSALAVIGLTLRLYLGLFPMPLLAQEQNLPQEQLPLPLESNSEQRP
jgi:hypothetical protein